MALPYQIIKKMPLKSLKNKSEHLNSRKKSGLSQLSLVELSLEHNKLVRPLLVFRSFHAMVELQVLRLFGNPLEFLPKILHVHKRRHLSLANIRIVADDNLRSVNMENSSYFVASRHKLSAFFSLIFHFSSFVGKDENAVRQLISMITSDDHHVVEQACSALSSQAADVSVAMQLMKFNVMQPIEVVLESISREEVIYVLQVVLAFASDTVAQKMLTKDLQKSLKMLCAHKNPEVQRLALLAVGNLALCFENRQLLVTSESLQELLLHLTVAPKPCVNKAVARALAILGENENLRRAIRGRQVPKQGLRILAMDGGGMKGLETIQILKEIKKVTGKRIHELFDLICVNRWHACRKLVFAKPVLKDNEAVTWREKLDQLYKSSSQSFRVVVHGSKHSANQFESLLKEMCADEDGDLLIESVVRNVPKVFVVSTLVSVMLAQPFVFRNYQYPAGTPEMPLGISESSAITILGSPTTGAQVGYKRIAFIGSCKHQVWQAIRASSAAPYYLDDYSNVAAIEQLEVDVSGNVALDSALSPGGFTDCLLQYGASYVYGVDVVFLLMFRVTRLLHKLISLFVHVQTYQINLLEGDVVLNELYHPLGKSTGELWFVWVDLQWKGGEHDNWVTLEVGLELAGCNSLRKLYNKCLHNIAQVHIYNKNITTISYLVNSKIYEVTNNFHRSISMAYLKQYVLFYNKWDSRAIIM
ncbi:hypothetical protein UlMin_033297 [Ulmus minor]